MMKDEMTEKRCYIKNEFQYTEYLNQYQTKH